MTQIHWNQHNLSNIILIAVCILSAGSFVVAFLMGIFIDDEGVDLWSTGFDDAGSVLGAIAVIMGAYRGIAHRKEIKNDAVQRAMDELKEIAAQRRPTLGGRSPQLKDYYAVPWSFVGRLGASQKSSIENTSCGNVQTLAELLVAASRAVVVLGSAGAGKTTLAELTQTVGASVDEQSGERSKKVPVYLNMSSWDPFKEDLISWALSQLPRRAALGGVHLVSPTRVISSVFRRKLCLLLLDGFDELPTFAKTKALENIASSNVDAVVIFSQGKIEQFHPIATRLACDVVQLESLDIDEVVEHLVSIIFGDSQWKKVIVRIKNYPNSPLATVLRRPLFLALATDMIHHMDEPPELFFNSDAIECQVESELLKSEIRAALVADVSRPGKLKGSKMSVEKHLQFLAKLQLKQHRDNIVWWDLSDAAPWPAKAIIGGIFTYIFVSISVHIVEAGWRNLVGPDNFIEGTFIDHSSIVFVSLMSSVFIAAKGNPSVFRTEDRKWYNSGVMRCGITLLVSVWVMLPGGWNEALLGSSYIEVLFFTAVTYLAFAFGAHVMISDYAGDEHPKLQNLWRSLGWLNDNLPRAIPRQLGWSWSLSRLSAGAIFGAVCTGVMFGGRLSMYNYSILSGVGVWEVAGVAFSTFLMTTLLAIMVLSFGKPLNTDLSTSFARSVFSNLMFGIITPCLWLLSFFAAMQIAITAGETVIQSDGQELNVSSLLETELIVTFVSHGLLLGLLCFICFGFIGLLMTLGGRFLLSLFWMRIFHGFPFRIFRFMESVHDRGLLRRQGFAYSFRHAQLRNFIAMNK